MHIGFKVKYCHEIFVYKQVKDLCEKIFLESAKDLDIEIIEIGFHKNHVHMIVDMGIRSIPEIAKCLKGRSGKKILKKFPWIKKKYFWGSGVWNPATFFDSVGNNRKRIREYVRNQGKNSVQVKLTAF
jgi:putative transposase